jgi:hypothetical protein
MYTSLRNTGHNAKDALYIAKTVNRWQQFESDGLVRLRAEPEQESYISVYGKPDAYVTHQGKRVSEEQAYKELCELLERDGCWYCLSEYWDGEQWQHADSVGMNTGYNNPLDPKQNCYVPDLMQAAMDAVENLAIAPAI